MKWLKKLWEILKKLLEDKPAPPPPAYVVVRGDRIQKIARGVEFDMLVARTGDQSIEDVPCWLYKGGPEDLGLWNGGNSLEALVVRVKVNNPDSVEMKVTCKNIGFAEEPDLFCGWKAGEKKHIRFELRDLGVKLTVNDNAPIMVACPTYGDHTFGVGWPPQQRQGCLGSEITNLVWL